MVSLGLSLEDSTEEGGGGKNMYLPHGARAAPTESKIFLKPRVHEYIDDNSRPSSVLGDLESYRRFYKLCQINSSTQSYKRLSLGSTDQF